MDEVFRKAAEGYPLKTDNSDWEGLRSRLLSSHGIPDNIQKKSSFNKYGLPLLLVLLMLFLGGGLLKQSRNRTTTYSPSTVTTEANTDKGIALPNLNTTTVKQQQRSQRPLNKEKVLLRESDQVPENGTLLTGASIEKSSDRNARIVEAPDLTCNTEQQVNTDEIVPARSSLSFNKPIAEGIIEKKVDAIQRPAKLYWSIVFGPGINRVKKQRIQKPGFDIGIMAGLPVLKGRAAVEAGLLYTQKYYFSDGKYFDMDKAGGSMPQGMEIMSLEGSSRLFELPVKFKYRVLQKDRSGVYLSAGISSYLMTREENDYLTMMNGSEQPMFGSYKNSRRYVAVTVNAGIEFNYKLGKHTRLGVEPYWQIPLRGIGIGSMPVMTSGIHFGFTRLTP